MSSFQTPEKAVSSSSADSSMQHEDDIQMNASNSLDDTPCLDERRSRSSTPDPASKGRKTPTPDASPIRDRSEDSSYRSASSGDSDSSIEEMASKLLIAITHSPNTSKSKRSEKSDKNATHSNKSAAHSDTRKKENSSD